MDADLTYDEIKAIFSMANVSFREKPFDIHQKKVLHKLYNLLSTEQQETIVDGLQQNFKKDVLRRLKLKHF